MMITVFTPTYNRAYKLTRLYESLVVQTYRNFEWVIVDDGSTDNTEGLCKSFIAKENNFPILYYKKSNGGKHTAINYGVSKAHGVLFFIVDSDDYLTKDSLKKISDVERSISGKKGFAGICGLRGTSEKDIIGTTFSGQKYLDITSLERPKYKINGDKAEVFYTEIMKQFPFPEYDGENFLTEAVVWNQIAFAGYKLRFFNEILYITKYLPDGLTAHYHQLLINNPRGYGLYISQNNKMHYYNLFDARYYYLEFYREEKNRLTKSEVLECLHATRLEYLKIVYLKPAIAKVKNLIASKINKAKG